MLSRRQKQPSRASGQVAVSHSPWMSSDVILRDAARVFEEARFDGRGLTYLIERVAQLRSKEIRVEQVGDSEWETITGLWVEGEDVTRVLTRRTDSALYQTHCLLHEIAHILFNHESCPGLSLPLAARRGRNPSSTSLGEEDPVQRLIEGQAESLAHLLAQYLFRSSNEAANQVFG